MVTVTVNAATYRPTLSSRTSVVEAGNYVDVVQSGQWVEAIASPVYQEEVL